MTNWVLQCPNCSKKFVHSKIEDTFANYFLPAKPKFPEGGQRLTCSHCGKELECFATTVAPARGRELFLSSFETLQTKAWGLILRDLLQLLRRERGF